VTAPAFFIVAAAAARSSGSEKLADMGGIAMKAPVLATMFLIVSFATLAMPGSSNFIGEFLILLGVFKAKIGIAIIAFSGVVGASVYALRLFITSMHNRQGGRVHSLEIRIGEAAAIIPLVAVIIALALYPQFGLNRSETTIDQTVAAANVGAIHGPATVSTAQVPSP
jgi:NADH-quinone oxidoreductase subunit M